MIGVSFFQRPRQESLARILAPMSSDGRSGVVSIRRSLNNIFIKLRNPRLIRSRRAALFFLDRHEFHDLSRNQGERSGAIQAGVGDGFEIPDLDFLPEGGDGASQNEDETRHCLFHGFPSSRVFPFPD